MTWDERVEVVRDMGLYGGGFVQALAVALQRADSENAARIEAAFPELLARYAAMGRARRSRVVRGRG